ncbi:MAG: hypothetical protein ACI8ZO_000475 [Flavobacteriales bacterium]|jgi:hypothetical protein
MSGELINKVAQSSLITFNLEDYYPQGKRMSLDITPWLFEELFLKEKDFRAYVKAQDWSQYKDAHLALFCSADAIVPTWAYMLIAAEVSPFVSSIFHGTETELNKMLFQKAIDAIDTTELSDQRVIVKGCSNLPVPEHAYVAIVNKLQPIVKSLMFGEACSSVPLYKKKK